MALSRNFSSKVPANVSVEVELTVTAKDLPDLLVKSDYMCVVLNQPFGRAWQEYARTEVQKNDRNPKFSSKIKINYCFEEQQNLKFQIFGISSPSLSKCDYVGAVECTLDEIVAVHSLSKDILLLAAHHGSLTITVDEICQHREELELKLTGQDLKTGLMTFGLPNPFLTIHRDVDSESKLLVHRTISASNSKNPTWPAFSVPLRALKNERGEYAQMTLQCLDYKQDENHKLIGSTQIHSRQLLESPTTFTLTKNNVERGLIHLKEAQRKRAYSFFEYISKGSRLSCTFAIDFSASYGKDKKSENLHFSQPETNDFENTLRAVGSILKDYNANQDFPILGFDSSQIFLINKDASSGIDGAINGYRSCLKSVTFPDGPSSFAPVINHAVRLSTSSSNDYSILLILTSGNIADLTETSKEIVKASKLPISIVFIGIGDNDFDSMELFEDNMRKLSLHGPNAVRDMVQFVPLREVKVKHDPSTTGFHLAKRILAEIPAQFLTYMKLNNILPKDRPAPQG